MKICSIYLLAFYSDILEMSKIVLWWSPSCSGQFVVWVERFGLNSHLFSSSGTKRTPVHSNSCIEPTPTVSERYDYDSRGCVVVLARKPRLTARNGIKEQRDFRSGYPYWR